MVILKRFKYLYQI